jgi:hypothetical protein
VGTTRGIVDGAVATIVSATIVSATIVSATIVAVATIVSASFSGVSRRYGRLAV